MKDKYVEDLKTAFHGDEKWMEKPLWKELDNNLCDLFANLPSGVIFQFMNGITKIYDYDAVNRKYDVVKTYTHPKHLATLLAKITIEYAKYTIKPFNGCKDSTEGLKHFHQWLKELKH